MSKCNKSPKVDQHSIKYRLNQRGGPLLDDVDLSCVEYTHTLSNKENKHCYKNSNVNSPELLSTSQLVSAIGQIWDSASRPLFQFHPKENLNEDDASFQKEKILDSFGTERNGGAYTSTDGNYFPVNQRATGYVSHMVQAKLDFPKVTHKMLLLESFNESQCYVHSIFQRILQASPCTNSSYDFWKGKEFVRQKISFGPGKTCWMSKNAPAGLKCSVRVAEPDNTSIATSAAGDCISVDTTKPALANEGNECNLDLTIYDCLALFNDAMLDLRKSTSLSSNHLLRPLHETKTDIGVSQTLYSSICADYRIKSLVTRDGAFDACQHRSDDNELLETEKRHFSDTITDDQSKIEFSSSNQKPHFSLAKQEHAFAGALAGICVSLCLHPVDTIKTVIQSRRAERKSIFYIGKSIVSDRGLTGLYRGITTNITCSAPISAVYTFTYESVKTALLPYLPMEYHSLAHCVAGGCASITTSFIFTPSERIKLQMQVGPHYRNCWDALVGIIRKDGFASLYAGWGAVLCRNIPHSIIKFYMYESLKQMMSSLPSSIRPNTLDTLVCGGLAGCTAALFTTPFDVIKTRLQTRIPGSLNQHDSVFHGLFKIGKHEGFRGLYRGLIPRLIMYMSQGALFFTSYELSKGLFSLQASNPHSIKAEDND
ncbi:hypothetical protein L6164_028233 [Bauhinia variegata]|uniref:Uncharacterized protein n=1 Tax=Bauhinia variegata TaxID=167791 RepID=A0ACB9LVF6_BAUVA|nr:hypothetical protein L6164_028233 [Bauhinia variegata]